MDSASVTVNVKVPEWFVGLTGPLTIQHLGRSYEVQLPTHAKPGDIIPVRLPTTGNQPSAPTLSSPPVNVGWHQERHRSRGSDSLRGAGGVEKMREARHFTPGPTQPPAPPQHPPPAPRTADEYGQDDENALRELLIQRCLELIRDAKNLTYVSVRNILTLEFGAERFKRYKSLVEYFLSRRAVERLGTSSGGAEGKEAPEGTS